MASTTERVDDPNRSQRWDPWIEPNRQSVGWGDDMTAIGREACPPCSKTDEMRYEALKTLSRNHRGRRPLVEGANRLSFKDPGKAGARDRRRVG